jgi:lipoprotein-anchoring transpeptidase ErfK/SrfK
MPVILKLSSMPLPLGIPAVRGQSPNPSACAIKLSRRTVLAGLSTTALSGCMSTGNPQPAPAAVSVISKPAPPPMYHAMFDGGFSIPAVDIGQVDKNLWRQDVSFETREKVGTLIVDTPARFLYHVKPNGRAMRYGVGVGREGFEWSGRAVVAYRRQWPRWTPPASMIRREPELARYAATGMAPGITNPLGARALYVFENGRDTLYRFHGTNEPASIGKSVSSGCIRLLNQDVIHLYNNVKDGSPVLVIPDPAMMLHAVANAMPIDS